jgi:hypothetical protein
MWVVDSNPYTLIPHPTKAYFFIDMSSDLP